VLLTFVCFFLGLFILVVGAEGLVRGSSALALRLGITPLVVGLTVVAFGTSSPGLTTSVVAALRKESDIAMGHIVGSNVFNILAILGIASLITPLFSEGFSHVDFAVMTAFAAILLPMAWSGRTLSRPEGSVLLLGYVAYMAWIWP
jgi:cation:H+ antiporter